MKTKLSFVIWIFFAVSAMAQNNYKNKKTSISFTASSSVTWINLSNFDKTKAVGNYNIRLSLRTAQIYTFTYGFDFIWGRANGEAEIISNKITYRIKPEQNFLQLNGYIIFGERNFTPKVGAGLYVALNRPYYHFEILEQNKLIYTDYNQLNKGVFNPALGILAGFEQKILKKIALDFNIFSNLAARNSLTNISLGIKYRI